MLVTGVLLGVSYTLIGAGLTIVLGVLRVVNLAQGILVVVGSFFAFDLFSQWGIDPVLSLLVIVPIFFVLGALTEVVLIRVPARDSPDRAMLVLFGLLMAGEALATLAWTSDSRSIDVGHANGSFTFRGIVVPEAYLIMAGVAVVLLGLTELLLYRTLFGKRQSRTSSSMSCSLADLSSQSQGGLSRGVVLVVSQKGRPDQRGELDRTG